MFVNAFDGRIWPVVVFDRLERFDFALKLGRRACRASQLVAAQATAPPLARNIQVDERL